MAFASEAPFGSAPPVQRVQELYRKESERIGKKDPDPALTQKRLSAAAAELTKEEFLWLLRQALDPKASADGRFFATYLIALSDKPQAMTALGGIAASPLPEKYKKAEKLEREIRSQAIVGLGRRCTSVAEAKDALLEVVASQADENLRTQAHQRLYECQKRKPAEAKDREGLERVLYGK